MSKQLTFSELLALSQQGRLAATVEGTLGGHPGRGYYCESAGMPVTLKPCLGGLSLHSEASGYVGVIREDQKVWSDGDLIWWGSVVTLHILPAAGAPLPEARLERAPL